jgi:hypothetical protein
MHSLWRGAESARLALDEHREIFQALTGGDPEQAERAARLHVARLQERLSWVARDVEANEPPRSPDPSPSVAPLPPMVSPADQRAEP